MSVGVKACGIGKWVVKFWLKIGVAGSGCGSGGVANTEVLATTLELETSLPQPFDVTASDTVTRTNTPPDAMAMMRLGSVAMIRLLLWFGEQPSSYATTDMSASFDLLENLRGLQDSACAGKGSATTITQEWGPAGAQVRILMRIVNAAAAPSQGCGSTPDPSGSRSGPRANVRLRPGATAACSLMACVSPRLLIRSSTTDHPP